MLCEKCRRCEQCGELLTPADLKSYGSLPIMPYILDLLFQVVETTDDGIKTGLSINEIVRRTVKANPTAKPTRKTAYQVVYLVKRGDMDLPEGKTLEDLASIHRPKN